MSRRSGNARPTRGAAASSRDTGLTLFDMTTCEPSAPTRQPSTSSAGASPVRTCQSQGKALASQARAAVCGSSSRASLASFDPASSSWKTSQRSCLGGWTSFSETFPKRGMMRSGSISALPTSEPRTAESGSSSSRGGGAWATATTADGMGGPERGTRQGGANLRTQVAESRLWPTATAGDASGSGSRNTPTSRAHAGVSLTDAVRGDGGTGRSWPTPNAADHRDRGTSEDACIRRRVEAGRQIDLSMSVPGSLNPAFVEALMGFPAGWISPLTDGPSAPAKRSPKASRRASRKIARSDGNG